MNKIENFFQDISIKTPIKEYLLKIFNKINEDNIDFSRSKFIINQESSLVRLISVNNINILIDIQISFEFISIYLGKNCIPYCDSETLITNEDVNELKKDLDLIFNYDIVEFSSKNKKWFRLEFYKNNKKIKTYRFSANTLDN